MLLDSYESGGSVLDQLSKLRQLMDADPDLGNHPPLCLLFLGNFGQGQGYIFQGILASLNENFTLFRSDGTPVRATVTCGFSESSARSGWSAGS